MEQTNEKTTGRSDKKKSGRDWSGIMIEFGLTCAQGLLWGVAAAVGGKVVSGMGSSESGRVAEAGDVRGAIPIRKAV